MRNTGIIAVVAIFTALLGAGSASATEVTPLCQTSSTHQRAKLERLDCGHYVGSVRVTNVGLGLTGHWELRDSAGHVGNYPLGDVWIGTSPMTIGVDKFEPVGSRFCAVLWEKPVVGSTYAQRGAPCVTIS